MHAASDEQVSSQALPDSCAPSFLPVFTRGKPPSACREELLGVAQLEAAYGIMSYQVQVPPT